MRLRMTGALLAAASLVLASLGACRGSAGLHGAAPPASNAGESPPQGAGAPPAGEPGAPAAVPAAPAQAPPRRTVTESEALRPRDDLGPEARALAVVDGQERWIDAAAAEAAGFTLVDLSDDWTPTIFAQQVGADGEPLPNRYRRIFLGLANDQLDNDGEPLPPGEKNYLELFGIFPALSAVRARFLEDEQHPCIDQETAAALEAVETVSYVAPNQVRKEARRIERIRQELEHARRKARVATIAELAEKQPAFAARVKLVEKRAAEAPAMAAVEKRLACEGLLGPPKVSHHQMGIYDDPMRLSVRRFQRKHMIYEANYLRKKTVDALARPLLDNDYDGVVRIVRERVVSAASIIEDGSTSKVRNLVDDYTKIALDQLGLVDAQAALAFFKRHPAADFQRLRAAVKLPERPDYYSDNMELSIVIDRGDVWYDLPFDDKGNFRYQARKKYPSLTLFTKVAGKFVALARWRTTIGGWRAEQASDGYEYFRYKMSDVGPRVIRNVVSGPVWIAPSSTPIRSLVKSKSVNRRWMGIVNYDELGPGYLSAYGLIAGYFVIPGQNGKPDFDNGVRAHGSSEYLSMYSAAGYSHGCHRLPNHLAIRLYSFILRHRAMRVLGDSPMNFTRQFLWKEWVYEMKIPSRGYVYQLDPPLSVQVLEGNIMGDQKKPIIGYVPKPGIKYPGPPPPAPDSPEAKAGGCGSCGGGGGEE